MGYDKEVKRIMDAVKKITTGDQPMSILLYQPIAEPFSVNRDGRLVDVGIRPVGAPHDLIIGQPAGAGHSAIFSHHSSAKKPLTSVLKTDRIGQKIQRSYENSPIEYRKKQVELEKVRYTDSKIIWDSDALPPLNAYIHDITLTPFFGNPCHLGELGNRRRPVLGRLSVLSADKCPLVLEDMTHVSMSLGIEILMHRLKWLFNDENLSILGSLDICPLESRIWGVAKSLLNHHWLYPYNPLVCPILKSAGDDNLALFDLVGATPPPWHPSDAWGHESESPVEQFAHDIIALSAFVQRRADTQTDQIEKLVGSMFTFLHLLTGKIHVIEGNDEIKCQAPKTNQRKDRAQLVAVINNKLPDHKFVTIPAYKYVSATFDTYRERTERNMLLEQFSFATLQPHRGLELPNGCPKTPSINPDYLLHTEEAGKKAISKSLTTCQFDKDSKTIAMRWFKTLSVMSVARALGQKAKES